MNVAADRALQHAREREWALREILKIISQSRDDERRVFDIIFEKGAHLCRAPHAVLLLRNEAGDGIMAIFNDPPPCDDPAGDAVRLALAMRAQMQDLCREWRKLGHRLGFGGGISLGYATVGMVGAADRYEYKASGTAVNLGARICDRAEDGEILLSRRMATAVKEALETGPIGEIAFNGIREPVEVFRLVGAPQPDAAG